MFDVDPLFYHPSTQLGTFLMISIIFLVLPFLSFTVHRIWLCRPCPEVEVAEVVIESESSHFLLLRIWMSVCPCF